MKVILTYDIRGVGRRGEEKEVSDGYAGNYLFPKRLAVPAAAGAAKNVREAEDARLNRERKSKSRSRRAARLLSKETLKFEERVSPAGKLYSSVSKDAIASAIKSLTGISGCGVEFKVPIKEPGTHSVRIILDSDTAVDVICDVRPIGK